MFRRLALPLMVLALAACNAEAPAQDTDQTPPPLDQPAQDVPPATAPVPVPEPKADSGLARFDGYGDMRFGMTEAEMTKAWGGTLNGDASGAAADQCHYRNPVSNPVPSYFAFMIDGGKFVRYDVGNDKEVAPGGGRRGMGADEIRSLYPGRVAESAHKYVEGGKYLTVAADDGSGGKLVFETDAAGKVSEWHVGVEPQVDYIEGCS
ncbi:MAG: lectin [Luteimonas sp.]